MEAHAKKLEQRLTDSQAEGKRLQALAGVCKARTFVLVEQVLVHLERFWCEYEQGRLEAPASAGRCVRGGGYKSTCFTSTKALALLAPKHLLYSCSAAYNTCQRLRRTREEYALY